MLGLPTKMKILLILARNSWKTEIKLFPVVRYFTWKLELVSDILWMIVGRHSKTKKIDEKMKYISMESNESYSSNVFFP